MRVIRPGASIEKVGDKNTAIQCKVQSADFPWHDDSLSAIFHFALFTALELVQIQLRELLIILPSIILQNHGGQNDEAQTAIK